MIGGQVEHGQAGKLGAPVLELAVQGVALEQVALPGGVVGVLDLQRRQAGGVGLAAVVRLVEGDQFVAEHLGGALVEGDVVCGEGEYVVLVGQPQQAGAQRRVGGQVEWLLGFAGQDVDGLLRRVVVAGQVFDGQLDRAGRVDVLGGDAVVVRERRAQDLVPGGHLR